MKTLRTVRDYIWIVLLALLSATNFEVFIFTNQFAPSGINGLATMIQYVFGFSVGYMSLIVNVPLCIAAYFILDRKYAFETMTYTVAFSLFILMYSSGTVDISDFYYHTDNGTSTVLAPIAAGIVYGFVFSSVTRIGGSTGGTDVIGAIIHKYNPQANMVWTIFALNASVAVISYFVYGYNIEPVICCLIYCFLTSKVGDMMLRGGRQVVKFEIITRHSDEISDRIVADLGHTSTKVDVTGMYSGSSETMLICIVNKWQVAHLRSVLAEYDGTFAYESMIEETLGNFRYKKKGRYGSSMDS
ncbi:MAG: YitT family protein [Oscillospiraceae bacterium]|jgi:uncharacterized membrane-anchored protein YitT (DUF2179 family)